MITLSASDFLEVGETVLGIKTDLARAHSKESITSNFSTNINTTRSGISWATKHAEETMGLDLEWTVTDSTTHTQLLATQRALYGAKTPLVLLPDSSAATAVYHGRIGDVLSWEYDYPIYNGIAWQFLESGRTLRG